MKKRYRRPKFWVVEVEDVVRQTGKTENDYPGKFRHNGGRYRGEKPGEEIILKKT